MTPGGVGSASSGVPLRVRPARGGDLPRLLEIRYAAFAAQAPAAYSPTEVETLLADVDPGEISAMIEGSRLFVAIAGGDVIGLAGWLGAALRHVYVDPRYARSGVGAALLAHVEADFVARTGAATIVAGVALHASGFYLAHGYEIVERARAWDGSAYLRMRKRLARPTCPRDMP